MSRHFGLWHYGSILAIVQPGRIASLSLIARTARFRGPEGNYNEWLAPLDQGEPYTALEHDSGWRFGVEHPGHTKWIIDEMCRIPSDESAAMHHWVHGVDQIENLAKIASPALIVTGERDTLTDLSDASIIAERIPSSRVQILPDRQHNVAYTHPREVAPVVRSFVGGVASATD